MLTEQRYQIILDLLKEKKSVTATELKEILDTSESTGKKRYYCTSLKPESLSRYLRSGCARR